MEIKRGGKRVGAGRKPVAEKKVIITLYVKGVNVLKFGSVDKTKERLYNYIDEYSDDEPINEFKDYTKPTNVIKPFEQPKTNYFATITPEKPNVELSEFESYKKQILETQTVPEVEAVMRKVKGALMFPPEKRNLEALAKEHSRSFYTD